MVRRNLAILVLLTLLAYGGVQLLYGNLEQRLRDEMVNDGTRVAVVADKAGPKPDRSEASGPEPAGSSETGTDYQVIVTRNIFQARIDQDKKEGKERPGPKPKKLAKTSLKLVLMGTVTGSDRDARAIIVDEKRKRQDIYHIGDVVQGALIKKVERGRVVLGVNGRDEVLLIKERKSGAGGDVGSLSYPAVPQPRPASVRLSNRKAAPVVRPHRRITIRKVQGQEREIQEPFEPIPVEELPPLEDEQAGGAATGPKENDGEQPTGEDEALQ